MNNIQCICGNCRTPIFLAQHAVIINPDGIVEVTIICKCGRKFYGSFGIPENFEVLNNDKEESES